MTDVTCCVGYCAHNIGDMVCNADTLTVHMLTKCKDANAGCATILPRNASPLPAVLENVNYGGLVLHAFNRQYKANPTVNCKAEACRYWVEGGECGAESIIMETVGIAGHGGAICSRYTH